jgi:hypothetical protein
MLKRFRSLNALMKENCDAQKGLKQAVSHANRLGE